MACMTVFSWYPHLVQVFHLATGSFADLSAPQPYNRTYPNPPKRFGTATGINLNGMHILFCALIPAHSLPEPGQGLVRTIKTSPEALLHDLLHRECGYDLLYPSPNNPSCSGTYVYYPSRPDIIRSRAYLYPPGARFLFSQRPKTSTQVTFPLLRLTGNANAITTIDENSGEITPKATKPYTINL